MNKILLFGTFFLFASNIFGQIQNGIVAHFSFDNNLNDLSSSGIVATNYGAAFGNDMNGTLNYALSLNGTSSYVGFNDNAVKVPLPITISAWVKLNYMGGFNAHIIFSSDNEPGALSAYGMYVLPSGQIVLALGDNELMSGGTVSTNTWHHIIGIIRGSNDMSIYLDCNELTGDYSGSAGPNPVYTTFDSRIGSYSNGTETYYLDGNIDDLIIWDRELIPSEIAIVCDTSSSVSLNELNVSPKELITITDLMGRETEDKPNTLLIYVYSDGTTEKVFRAMP